MRTRAWTEQDINKLKALATSGTSALRVSVVLKRSVSMVKKKAQDIGVPFPSEAELRAKRRRIFLNTNNGSPRFSAQFGARVSPRIDL